MLAELGRNGVGGRLRSGYLHRRLAWETCGEVVFEDLWPDRAGEYSATVRMSGERQQGCPVAACVEDGVTGASRQGSRWDVTRTKR